MHGASRLGHVTETKERETLQGKGLVREHQTLWFLFLVHSFFHQTFRTAFSVLALFWDIGIETQTQPLPLETSDQVRERDANTIAVHFKASHRSLAKVHPLDLPIHGVKGDEFYLPQSCSKMERGYFGSTNFPVTQDVQRLLDDQLVRILQRGHQPHLWPFFQP